MVRSRLRSVACRRLTQSSLQAFFSGCAFRREMARLERSIQAAIRGGPCDPMGGDLGRRLRHLEVLRAGLDAMTTTLETRIWPQIEKGSWW